MSIKQHEALVRKKAQQYEECFKTVAGEAVLEDLKAEYLRGELFDSDPLKMAGKVAQHDVIARILDLMRVAQHDRDE